MEIHIEGTPGTGFDWTLSETSYHYSYEDGPDYDEVICFEGKEDTWEGCMNAINQAYYEHQANELAEMQAQMEAHDPRDFDREYQDWCDEQDAMHSLEQFQQQEPF